MSQRVCWSRQHAAGSVLLLVSLLLAASAPLASGRGPQPRMVVPEASYDFGDVFVGQYMYHVFSIRNEGTAPLILSDELPGKPLLKPAPLATGAYTHPRNGANRPFDALTEGAAFGVRRPGAALVASGARSGAWYPAGEAALASGVNGASSANPAVSGEPVPT